MKVLHHVLNKQLSYLSAADYLKIKPIVGSSSFPELLTQCSVSQFERLVLLMQLDATPTVSDVLHAHVQERVSPNSAAFWRFQILIANGAHSHVFEQYQATKPSLDGPISVLMDALWMLDSKLVSNRPQPSSVSELVGRFKGLAMALSSFDYDDIELIERSVFPIQLAQRHELVHQAGKVAAKLKPTEKTGVQKKAVSHALCLIPADVLLSGI